MSKGYERWHCGAGHQPGVTPSLYQPRRGRGLGSAGAHLMLGARLMLIVRISIRSARGGATVRLRASKPPRDSSRRRSESRFEADRAGKGRTAMPSGGRNQLRATELTAGASTVGARSRSASHRSHCNGEAAK
jgi:hypothetical protein